MTTGNEVAGRPIASYLGMRYDATEFADGVTEVLAYGAAVRLAGG